MLPLKIAVPVSRAMSMPPKSVVSDASGTFVRRVDGARGWCRRVIGRDFGAHPGAVHATNERA